MSTLKTMTMKPPVIRPKKKKTECQHDPHGVARLASPLPQAGHPAVAGNAGHGGAEGQAAHAGHAGQPGTDGQRVR